MILNSFIPVDTTDNHNEIITSEFNVLSITDIFNVYYLNEIIDDKKFYIEKINYSSTFYFLIYLLNSDYKINDECLSIINYFKSNNLITSIINLKKLRNKDKDINTLNIHYRKMFYLRYGESLEVKNSFSYETNIDLNKISLKGFLILEMKSKEEIFEIIKAKYKENIQEKFNDLIYKILYLV